MDYVCRLTTYLEETASAQLRRLSLLIASLCPAPNGPDRPIYTAGHPPVTSGHKGVLGVKLAIGGDTGIAYAARLRGGPR